MSDFLDVQYQVNFLKETPPENYKLMNVKQKVLAGGYINGEKLLQAYEEDVKISEDLTNFYFVSDRPVTLTFENEDGDSFTFEKMQQFSYFCVDFYYIVHNLAPNSIFFFKQCNIKINS